MHVYVLSVDYFVCAWLLLAVVCVFELRTTKRINYMLIVSYIYILKSEGKGKDEFG